MEEVKKEVKIDTPKVEEQKISYDKLKEIASQLHNQNQQLVSRVRELEFTLNQVRLEYLFAVVKHGDKFPQEFVEMCTKDIVRALSPIEKKEEPDSKEEE